MLGQISKDDTLEDMNQITEIWGGNCPPCPPGSAEKNELKGDDNLQQDCDLFFDFDINLSPTQDETLDGIGKIFVFLEIIFKNLQKFSSFKKMKINHGGPFIYRNHVVRLIKEMCNYLFRSLAFILKTIWLNLFLDIFSIKVGLKN